jgi:hypothetical protein
VNIAMMTTNCNGRSVSLHSRASPDSAIDCKRLARAAGDDPSAKRIYSSVAESERIGDGNHSRRLGTLYGVRENLGGDHDHRPASDLKFSAALRQKVS